MTPRGLTALLVLLVIVPLLMLVPKTVVIPMGTVALILFAAIWHADNSGQVNTEP